MTIKLDHVFILTDPGAPQATQLAALGLIEGTSNEHLGQGTANRRFFFSNTMLELLYVRDAAEAMNGPGHQLRFVERTSNSELRISVPSTQPSSVLKTIAQAEGVTLRLDEPHLLEIVFNDGKQGRSNDLRPNLPLLIDW